MTAYTIHIIDTGVTYFALILGWLALALLVKTLIGKWGKPSQDLSLVAGLLFWSLFLRGVGDRLFDYGGHWATIGALEVAVREHIIMMSLFETAGLLGLAVVLTYWLAFPWLATVEASRQVDASLAVEPSNAAPRVPTH